MRTMLKVTLDTQAGSDAISRGGMPQFMQEALSKLQPEAAFFGPLDGHRTAFFVFDLKDPSDLPRLTEPFFSNLKAKIDMFPVMNLEDLQKGLGQLGQNQS